MAKHVDQLTVGIVTKVMRQIGYCVFDRNTGKLEDETVYPSLEEAMGYAGEYLDLEVKPVYVEESEKSF